MAFPQVPRSSAAPSRATSENPSEGSVLSPGREALRQLLSESANKPLYSPANHRPLSLAINVLKTQPEARALFESPQHLEELDLPDATKIFIRILRNPPTGGTVYLVGTAHVSEASKDDVRMLIEAVAPDAVAIELDPGRLFALETGLNSASAFPTTTFGVLKLRFEHESFSRLRQIFDSIFAAQIIGEDYGCDFLSALKTARRLDVPVKMIDLARLAPKATGVPLPTLGASISNNDTLAERKIGAATSEEADAAAYGFKLALKPSGCEDPEAARLAYNRLRSAFHQSRPIPMADLAQYRACLRRDLEKMRYEGMNTAAEEGYSNETQERAARDRPRDQYMAAELARLAASHNKVVAVMGAGHVPGVRAYFPYYTLAAHINAEGKARFHNAEVRRGIFASFVEKYVQEKQQRLLSEDANGSSETLIGAAGSDCAASGGRRGGCRGRRGYCVALKATESDAGNLWRWAYGRYRGSPTRPRRVDS